MRYTELIEKPIENQNKIDLTIRNECSDYFKKVISGGRLILRGIEEAYIDFKRYDTNKYPRVSANTENYYTMLTNILPSWQGWPVRSRSIICASSNIIAKQYGDVYVIFPSNGCTLGIAPKDDFWRSFKRIKLVGCDPQFLDEFNDQLYELIHRLAQLEGYSTETESMETKFISSAAGSNISQFAKALQYFDNLGKKHLESLNDDLKNFFKINNSLMDTINWILDPTANGHILGNPKTDLPNKREVWVQGVVYLMSKKQLMKSMPDFYNLVKHQF